MQCLSIFTCQQSVSPNESSLTLQWILAKALTFAEWQEQNAGRQFTVMCCHRDTISLVMKFLASTDWAIDVSFL
jgi:hypothetical protein